MIGYFGGWLALLVANTPVAFSLGIMGVAWLMFEGGSLATAPQRLIGGIDSFPLLAVPLFILSGLLMNASGVSDRIYNFAKVLVGHFAGGLGHVNVVGSLIFSGMSGSAIADAGGLGVLEIEQMKKDGYPEDFSGALTCASCIIGPLVPPSIPMIFYALIANASVGAMFLGGLVPAGLMAASLMTVVAVVSWRRGFPREPRVPWSALPRVFARALLPLALPGLLLGMIYSGLTTPTEAAAIAATYALGLALLVYRTLSFRSLLKVITDTVRGTAMIALIMCGAFVFNYAVANENVPQTIRAILLGWNLSATGFLLCVDLLMLLLAVVLDEVTILLVIVPLLVPIAQALGIDLVHFGIVVVLNMMVGLALPPHGLLLFVINGLTGTPLGEIFREVPIFVAAMLVVLIAVTLWPALALTVPHLFGYVTQ